MDQLPWDAWWPEPEYPCACCASQLTPDGYCYCCDGGFCESGRACSLRHMKQPLAAARPVPSAKKEAV